MIHLLVSWIISSLQIFWQILYSVRLLIEGITRSRIALGSGFRVCFHPMQALLLVMPSTSSLLPLHLFIISWPDINYWCNIVGFGWVKLFLNWNYLCFTRLVTEFYLIWIIHLQRTSLDVFFFWDPQKRNSPGFFGNPLCSISFQINNEPSCMGWPHASVISGFNNGVYVGDFLIVTPKSLRRGKKNKIQGWKILAHIHSYMTLYMFDEGVGGTKVWMNNEHLLGLGGSMICVLLNITFVRRNFHIPLHHIFAEVYRPSKPSTCNSLEKICVNIWDLMFAIKIKPNKGQSLEHA